METRFDHEILLCHQFGLFVAALVGVGVYAPLDVISQLQPPHYSVLHQSESDLGVGPYSAIMNANFIVRGLTALAGVSIGQPLRRCPRVAVILIATWGVCAALLSVFHTDVTSGPLVPVNPTVHGNVHLALAFAGFLACSVGIVLLWTAAVAAARLRKATHHAGGPPERDNKRSHGIRDKLSAN